MERLGSAGASTLHVDAMVAHTIFALLRAIPSSVPAPVEIASGMPSQTVCVWDGLIFSEVVSEPSTCARSDTQPAVLCNEHHRLADCRAHVALRSGLGQVVERLIVCFAHGRATPVRVHAFLPMNACAAFTCSALWSFEI